MSEELSDWKWVVSGSGPSVLCARTVLTLSNYERTRDFSSCLTRVGTTDTMISSHLCMSFRRWDTRQQTPCERPVCSPLHFVLWLGLTEVRVWDEASHFLVRSSVSSEVWPCKLWFSNFSVRQNLCENPDCWASHPEFSASVGLGWGPRIYTSGKFPGDADDLSQVLPFGNRCCEHITFNKDSKRSYWNM